MKIGFSAATLLFVLTHSALSAEEASDVLWSLRPLQRPDLQADASVNPVDALLGARHEKAGLRPLGQADAATLIRRATFDLTGLPPTPEEVEAFIRETASDHRKAFDKLVNRLLESPRYGERWARHWLDVARYADTAGDAGDFPIPEAWRYRNWVIEAIQADMPYDQFVTRQIAGDLMPAADQQERDGNLIATGYLALSKRFGQNPRDLVHTVDDTVDNVTKAMLGLTVSCARCHDHKFDPIPARDYFALYGIFESTRYSFPGLEHRKDSSDHVPLGPPENAERWQSWLDEIAKTEKEISALSKDKALSAEARKKKEKDLGDHLAKLRKEPPPVPVAFAAMEAKPADTTLRLKGEFSSTEGDDVRRGFLTALGGAELPADCQDSGRLHLAKWITDASNPLTARVMMNRVWLHHFGKPLVSTPDDFGTRSVPPVLPELLDFLAIQFMESGWSLKAMHRLILQSETWQRASLGAAEVVDANHQIDPENQLFWRFESRRLSAEEVRDSLLYLGGNLDLEPGERHPFPAQIHFAFSQHRPFYADYPTQKRSIYLMQTRLDKQPFLRTFDGAEPTTATGLRSLSVSPMQALFHLNDQLTTDQAAGFAEHLHKEQPSDASSRIERAWLHAFARPPTDAEKAAVEEFLAAAAAAWSAEKPQADGTRQAWVSLARTLLAANEFSFVQ